MSREGKKLWGGYIEEHEADWLDQAASQAGLDSRTALLKYLAAHLDEMMPQDRNRVREANGHDKVALSAEQKSMIFWLQHELQNQSFSRAIGVILRKMGWNPSNKQGKKKQ